MGAVVGKPSLSGWRAGAGAGTREEGSMPGPGPHMIYALGSGVGLMYSSNSGFSPQHCLFYATNAFLGPDLGSFAEWLSSLLSLGPLGSFLMHALHHPFHYVLLLGYPFSFLYAYLSKILLHRGLLDTVSGELKRLFFAGASYPKAMLPAGGRSPSPAKHVTTRTRRSMFLIMAVASLYCLWCASQIYWRRPPRAAVGEEADLGKKNKAARGGQCAVVPRKLQLRAE
ncbi:hypothetical protein ACLOJK_031155 [Asimina triloba]